MNYPVAIIVVASDWSHLQLMILVAGATWTVAVNEAVRHCIVKLITR